MLIWQLGKLEAVCKKLSVNIEKYVPVDLSDSEKKTKDHLKVKAFINILYSYYLTVVILSLYFNPFFFTFIKNVQRFTIG